MTQALATRRGLRLATTGSGVAGAVLLIAAGRSWVRFTVDRVGLPAIHAHASGEQLVATAVPLGLVVLAAVVALPAARRVGRRVVGALVAGCALVIGWGCTRVVADPGASAHAQTARVAGIVGVRGSTGVATAWPWIALVAAVLALAAGLVAAAYGPAWPAMSRRYEATSAAASGTPVQSDTALWDSIDRGDDPTV